MRVLSMILAGGKGRRLFPLTRHRTKPAVPYGGNYRLVDFVLSNLVNSGMHSIYVLVQYRAQSLIEHLRTSWPGQGISTDQFITVVPPQMRHGESWYRGSADAVAQNLNLVQNFRPDILAVFAGDLVFRMDVRPMLDFHRQTGAEVTLACARVAIGQARARLGVVQTHSDGRIRSFEEKPSEPEPLDDRPGMTLASMGCFLFEPAPLIEILQEKLDQRDQPHDLSREVFPQFVDRGRSYAYDFQANEIPGIQPYERQGYWYDVGTIGSYWSSHMDLLGAKPPFDLRNPQWPIHPARVNLPPSRMLSARIEDSLIGEGARIEDATIRRSLLGRGVILERGAVIEDSIIMDYSRIGAGAQLSRAIVDRFNEIAPGGRLSSDSPSADERCHLDRDSGIVVLPRGGIASLPEDFFQSDTPMPFPG